MIDYKWVGQHTKLWTKLVEEGKKREKGMTNTLQREDVETIIATMMFFDLNRDLLRQAFWDLTIARYRVFDWLAMLLNGRCMGYGEQKDEQLRAKNLSLIFAYIYLEKTRTPQEFIDYLRYHDLQVEWNDLLMKVEEYEKKL